MAPRLHIVIGSTRPGRIGPAVARWFADAAAEHGRFEPVLVDLAAFGLPVFDEPKHPRLRQYAHDHTRAWSASVAAADAFAFVTPEYNYFPPPALVNALDYLVAEWGYAPAGIVSYGGLSGGLRAAQALKPLLAGLRMMPVPEGVAVPAVQQHVVDGAFVPLDLHRNGAAAMLDELHRWTGALGALRAERKA